MRQVSSSARGQVDLAGIGLGVGDELGDRLGRERRVRQQDEGIVVDARDRNNVARDNGSALLIEHHVDRVRSCDHQQRVAVSRCARHRLQGEVPAAAGPVVDDNRLAKPRRQRLTKKPRDDVGCSASRNDNHQGHGPGRIGLRPWDARERR